MKRMLNKYTIYTAVALVLIGVGIRLQWFTGQYALAEALAQTDISAMFPSEQQMKERFEEGTAKLKECMRECPAEEAELAERYLVLMESIFQNESDPEQVFEAFAKINSEAIDLYEKENDFENLVTMYSSSQVLVDQGVKDPAFAEKVARGIRDLPVKFPQQAKAYSVFGQYLISTGASDVEVISAYRQCLLLDNTNSICRENYDRWVEIYARPRCFGTDLLARGFGLHAADVVAASGLRPTPSVEGTTYYIEPNASVNGADIAQIYSSQNEYGMGKTSFTLTESGRAKLAELTRKNIGKSIALVFDGKVASAPSVQEEIKSGDLQLSEGLRKKNDPTIFERLCPKPTTPELPAELKL